MGFVLSQQMACVDMNNQEHMINVGGSKIGLAGLTEIFEEVKMKNICDEQSLKTMLLERVKSQNYIPESKEIEYETALLREYKKFLGEEVDEQVRERLEIKILGPGCHSCDKLLQETKSALAELGEAAEVEHVKSLKEIGRYGMLATPALLINGEVKTSGKVPNREQIKKWLEEA